MKSDAWFAFWSKRRPDDVSPIIQLGALRTDAEKRAVAVRTALRGFSGLTGIDNAPWSLSDKLGVPLKLHSLRAVFVAWCRILYDGVRPQALSEAFEALVPLLTELDEALPDFYERNIMGSDYALASWQDSVEAGRRSAGLVEAIERLAFRPLPFDQTRKFADFLDTLKLYGPDGRDNQQAWRAAQRSAIGADCEVLRTGQTSCRELMLAPLWPSPAAAALETNLAWAEWKEFGQYLKIWLRERKDGALVMGKDPETMATRMVRIANLSPAFWNERSASDTLYALNYTLHGDLDNPSWGSLSMKRL